MESSPVGLVTIRLQRHGPDVRYRLSLHPDIAEGDDTEATEQVHESVASVVDEVRTFLDGWAVGDGRPDQP